jgi:hypothetical protein
MTGDVGGRDQTEECADAETCSADDFPSTTTAGQRCRLLRDLIPWVGKRSSNVSP